MLKKSDKRALKNMFQRLVVYLLTNGSIKK